MQPVVSATLTRAVTSVGLPAILHAHMTRHDSDGLEHQVRRISEHPRWHKRGGRGASSTDRVYVQGDCPICGHWQVPIPGAGQRVIEWLDKSGHHMDMETCPNATCPVRQPDLPVPW